MSRGRSHRSATTPTRGGPIPAAIVASSVTRSFGATVALDGVDFTATAGEIHALVGENGSGKSTLAKVMSGILKADRGSVSVFGEKAGDPHQAHRLGLATVLQEVLVAEGSTIEDNLFLGHDGVFRRSGPAADRRRKAEGLLLRLTGRTLDLRDPIDSLSLQDQQWIVIARELLREPRAIILDEASAALDRQGADRLFRELRDLAASGVCVIVVTHRIEELESNADRVTVLRDGRLVGTISGADISSGTLIAMMTGAPSDEAWFDRSRLGEPAPPATHVVIDDLALSGCAPPFSLRIDGGRIIGVASLEGQGGSEFVRCLAGLTEPRAGRISVEAGGASIPVTGVRHAHNAGVAYIPGDRKREGVFPNMSTFENFAVARYRARKVAGFIQRSRVRDEFQALSATLALGVTSPGTPIGQLSGGNQQKVLIARALAGQPKVMVLNDPTRGVDLMTKNEIYRLLASVAATGAAVVFFSTELDELLNACHQIAVLYGGTLEAVLGDANLTKENVLGAMFGQTRREVAC